MFGRKKDEGGIPGLGSLSGSATPSARPSGIPGAESGIPGAGSAPASGPAATPAGGAPRPAYGGGTPNLGASTPPEPWEVGPWTIRIFVLAFFAAFAVLFASEEHRRMNDPVDRASRGEVTITTADSLVRPANLSKALRLVKAKAPAGATLESLRLEPARIDATVAQPDGAQFQFTVDPGFSVEKDTYPASEPEGLPLSQIPTDVPQRLVGTVESKLGLKARDLDYIVLNLDKGFDGGRDDSWNLYYTKPPLHNDATATLQGKDVRLLGTPDAASRAAQRKAAHDSLASLARAERQIKSANFPSEAMRKQSLAQIHDAQARAEQTLKEMTP